jgi:hypothetical protein
MRRLNDEDMYMVLSTHSFGDAQGFLYHLLHEMVQGRQDWLHGLMNINKSRSRLTHQDRGVEGAQQTTAAPSPLQFTDHRVV